MSLRELANVTRHPWRWSAALVLLAPVPISVGAGHNPGALAQPVPKDFRKKGGPPTSAPNIAHPPSFAPKGAVPGGRLAVPSGRVFGPGGTALPKAPSPVTGTSPKGPNT